MAAGAQDFLVKGRVQPDVVRRALLYAIERKRAELMAVDLDATQLRARENAILERGLSASRCYSTTRASTSSPGTGPAASTRCYAEVSTTSSKHLTAPCMC